MDTMPDNDPMENQAPLAGLDPADLLRQGAAEDTLVDEASSAFQPPPIGELAPLFPQFEILELIGKGGMGAVYKARQKDLDRNVALKILPRAIGQSPEFSERFTREARALAKLNHPGIVTIHEFGQQDGLYFILMEFVDGVNLAQLMKTGRVSPREALAIVPQICDALQYAHDQGIVHRDIKPENILLDRQGRVKVADFGIAKVVAAVCDPIRSGDIPVPADATLAGKIIGTPQYMAPEQIESPSEVDHRADIYALGVVFYQMLTGELPGRELQAPSRKVHIDVRLDEIVLQALEKKPEMRYQTAGDFRTRVQTIVSEKGSAGVPSASFVPPPDKNRGAGVSAESRISRTAIVGACWAPLFFVFVVFWFSAVTVVEVPPGGKPPEPTLWQTLLRFTLLPLGLTAPFGTTILGSLAVSQIRRSAGKLHGLWLAVLDGMLFPLLVMAGLIGWFWHWVFYDLIRSAIIEGQPELSTFERLIVNNTTAFTVLATIASSLVAGLIIIRRVWRAVKQSPSDQSQPHHKSPVTRSGSVWLMVAAACLVAGSLWLVLRDGGKSYPASSLSSGYKEPVIGRIEFKFSHPDSTGGEALGYPVKKWGDTQWHPSSGQSISLTEGRTLWVKSRVNAMRPDAPVAMVTTSSDDSEWETKQLMIDGNNSMRQLVFSNGLRVQIHWSPVDSSKDRSKAPDPTQHDVMLQASRESDRMHPLTEDATTSVKTPGMPVEKKLADYDWNEMAPDGGDDNHVRQRLDGRTCLKIENSKNQPLQVRLLTIEKPPISGTRYALRGEIRYEDVQGQGYMEMWSVFPEGRYFSRTLEASGPLGHLAGTSGWREFTLPFDRTGTAHAPTRIEVNLHLSGRGVVYVGPLELIETTPQESIREEDVEASEQSDEGGSRNTDLAESGNTNPTQERIPFLELPATNRLQLRVVAPDDPEAVEVVQIREDGTRTTLKLNDNVIVCDRHVKDAGIQATDGRYEVMITLDDEGAQRLAAATKDADGIMRLALLVDGEVIFAPVVQAQLGSRFVVTGMGDLEECLGLIRDLVDWPDDRDWSAMTGWLERVDQGLFGESWASASGYFRGNVTRVKWEEMLTAARRPLGALVTRKLSSAKRTESPPGAPDGLYLMSEFDTTFTEKKEAKELVTLVREQDGRWRVCGYFIR